MLIAVLSLAILNLVTVLSFTGIIVKLNRQSDRREDALIDRIMHLANRTWTPPPSEEYTLPNNEEEYDPSRYLTSLDTIPEE